MNLKSLYNSNENTSKSYNLNKNISDKDILDLLSKIQDVLKKRNEHFQKLNNLDSSFNMLSKYVVESFINTESNNDQKVLYHKQIEELKHIINTFYLQLEETTSNISSNALDLENFLQKHNVNICSNNRDNCLINDFSDISQPGFSKTETLPLENNTLLISEYLNKVFLPYQKQEIDLYLEKYPNEYNSAQDVINKEFILSLDYYIKHPIIARFREAYSLIRDREAKSILDSFKFAFDIMSIHNLNPAIIAACKTQQQLENYLLCLEKDKLDNFNDFEIKFQVAPLKLH